MAFPDIEPQPDGVLANPGLTNTRGKGLERIQKLQDHEAIAFYYEAARQFLHRHRFISEVQRRIWELHSEAVSVKRIESHLRREGRRGRVKHEVQTVIATLRGKMLNRRPRGKPRDPDGRSRENCERVVLRLNRKEVEALAILKQAWGARYRTKRYGDSTAPLIRALILECARNVAATL